MFGDGQQTRAFRYVDDMIEGFIKMTATGDEVTGPVNLGNPSNCLCFASPKRIIELTASKSRLIHRPLPMDD
jgi:UDP-glucuronate decarboxylase